MLRKFVMLGLASLGAVAVAPSANANAAPVCPYFFGDSGMTDEEIIAWCDAWEREQRVSRSPSGSSEINVKVPVNQSWYWTDFQIR